MSNFSFLDNIFKSYDIRGFYPQQINQDVFFLLGQCFSQILDQKWIIGKVAVGRDGRIGGEELKEAFIKWLLVSGKKVVDLDLIATDMLYFATGFYAEIEAGVIITASHNPKEYNGAKFSLNNAQPFSSENGLLELKELLKNKLEDKSLKLKLEFKKENIIIDNNNYEQKNIYDDWIKHATSFIKKEIIKPFKIVVDATNGVAGKIIIELQKKIPQLEILPLFFEVDGNFPNHEPSPLDPNNLVDLVKVVLDNQADFGMAFDGDADRLFFVDETGKIINGTIMSAMIAQAILEEKKGEVVLYNAVCGDIISDVVKLSGNLSKRVRVGHSFIKEEMKQTQAIFAGEHSGHYFFRDNWGADSGLIAGLLVLQLLSKKNESLSELAKELDCYFLSGEINFKVENKQEIMDLVANIYQEKAQVDWLDGVTVRFLDGWVNLRPSGTEPFLRLNVEAKTEKRKQEIIVEFQKIIEDNKK